MQTIEKRVITRVLGLTYAPCTPTPPKPNTPGILDIIDNLNLLLLFESLLCYASGLITILYLYFSSRAEGDIYI